MHLRCVRLCECPTTSGNSTMPGERSVDEHPPVSSTTVSITHKVMKLAVGSLRPYTCMVTTC